MCLSTIEQFSEINEDLLKLSKTTFHLITLSISFLVAVFEGYSMKGYDTIKSFFETKEHMPDLPNERKYISRSLKIEEIDILFQFAKKGYGSGYNFTVNQLKRWWQYNPNCFYGLFFKGNLVGYLDVFPIDKNDYRHLLDGKDERLITPLKPENVSDTSSLYIASFVVDKEHCAYVVTFVNKALKFYNQVYRVKNWSKVCAFAYTPKGHNWCVCKGMVQIDDTDVWFIDRGTLALLSKKNKVFWNNFFDF